MSGLMGLLKRNKPGASGVVTKKVDNRTGWEKMFTYAFSENHVKMPHRIFSTLLRAVIKPMMFNIETRTSFFSGIKANDDIGGLQDFLDSQRFICRELKSAYLPFYDDLALRYGPDRLYRTLKPYYPAAEVSIFSAGETSNNMKTACDVAITFLNRSYEIKNKVKAFVTMFAFYVAAFIAFIYLFTASISGPLEKLSAQMDRALPPVTQFYIDLNAWLKDYTIYIVIAVVLVAVLFAFSLPRGTGNVRGWAHRWMPGYRFYRRYSSCTFLLSLSAMLGAGMSFNEAIYTIRKSNSLGRDEKDGYIGKYMRDIERKLNSGAKPQRALDVDFMPKSMYLNVSQFIKGRDIGLTLLSVAEFELDSLTRSVDKYRRMLTVIILAVGSILLINGYKAAIEPAMTMFQNSGYS